ncbi:tRNA uridine 5-carboxymethylaminomethyl modification enzyme mnmG [Bacillus cereus Rock3-44]|nr:tRNA uridine 5-carboxymethylaminomethyl modification enzyme mnmG [Bacillus cereus Rock3-44]
MRHDNADLRLTEIGHEIGLIPDERYERFTMKKETVEQEKARLEGLIIKPRPEVQELIRSIGGSELKDGIRASDLLRRTEVTYEHIRLLVPSEVEINDEIAEQVEIQVKYEGYIEKSLQQVDRMKKMENKKIPVDIDYDAISGIASEARQKLKDVRPLSMGQASRISGVNPADISILLVYIEQGKIARVSNQ